MSTVNKETTKNIRIPTETHEAIKQKCKDEGRLMGAYVDGVLQKAINGDFVDVSQPETLGDDVTPEPMNTLGEATQLLEHVRDHAGA